MADWGRRDWVYGALFTVVGFIGNQIVNDMTRLADKLESLPHNYVLKADYNTDNAHVKHSIEKLSDSLDNWAERLEADYNRRLDKIEARQSKIEDNGK